MPGRSLRFSVQPTVLTCLDVAYGDGLAAAAGLGFRHWTDATPCEERTTLVHSVAPYVTGSFYERELPCLRAVLERLSEHATALIVDGYAWLGDGSRPGLGARLHEELPSGIVVIGVAKNPLAGNTCAVEVLRGKSTRPLFVTAAGMDSREAEERIVEMHGEHRIPTLLRRVDRVCRDALAAAE